MAALLLGLEKITYLISRCEIYEHLYLRIIPWQSPEQSFELLCVQAAANLE